MSVAAGESRVNNFKVKKKKSKHLFCSKFCITKIVKLDFFGLTIMEK